MRNTFFLLLFVLIVFSAQAQNNAPEVVQNNFKKMFAKAKKVKYSKETDGSWEIDFKQNKIKSSAKFSDTGEWLETENEIKKSTLPKEILAMLAKEYKGWKIEDCEKVQVPNKEPFFELEVKKGKESFELKIDASGKVLEKKKDEESEEDDKD